MSGLPDTTSAKPRRRPAPPYAVLAASLVLVAVAFFSLHEDEKTPPSEEVYAGVEETAVSTENVPFPRSDASRFDEGTTEVPVYLRV